MAEAVSYTHLDVYKRQVDDSASQLCTGSRELEAFKQVTWLTLQEEQRGTIAENYKDYLGL